MLKRSLLILMVMALVAMGVTAYMLVKEDDVAATIPLDVGTAIEERVTVYVTGAAPGGGDAPCGSGGAGCGGLWRRDARRGFSENQFGDALKRRPAYRRAGGVGRRGHGSGGRGSEERWSCPHQYGG